MHFSNLSLPFLLLTVVTSTPIKRATLSGYEYVIVGSGGGGGPLAARLARYGHSVLLLEAGDDQGANIVEQVPAFHGFSTQDENMRWDYFVNHYSDRARQAKDSKTVYAVPDGDDYIGHSPPLHAEYKGILYPRAGTLGGCGSHNAMITVLPHESDWEYISTLTGDDTWRPSNMKKYFEKLEHINYEPRSPGGHGKDGWLWTERPEVTLVLGDKKFMSQLVSAAAAMGQGIITTLLSSVAGLVNILLADMNSGAAGRDGREGLFQIPLARKNGARNGPREFVVETLNAKNGDGSKKYKLDLRMNCLVTKIIWDHSGSRPRAVGVEFLDGKSLYRADPRAGHAGQGTAGSVRVTKEVILSAGAFNTPQLLKLSGVGPKSELQKFNIPVVADLPGVGTNLQDRYEVGITTSVQSDFDLTKDCTFNNGTDPCLQRWKDTKKGPYESNGFASAIIKKTSASKGDPDIFMFGGPANFKGYYPGYATDALADKRHWTWVILKAHTGNTAGNVTLRSSDPKDTPVINFNYFDTGTASEADRDLTAMVEAVKVVRKVNHGLPPLTEKFDEVVPGTDVDTTDEVKDWIKNEAWGHHASCTCPIGEDGDVNAVLDSQFKVRKVNGLRVVDASVFPKIPGLFIAVPVYMVAEKAAEVIHAASS